MHTSTVLRPSDFHYVRRDVDDTLAADFTTFCPDYQTSDRIGVVSPRLEDGVVHASYAVLALTTAFYEVLRSRVDDFFDYPQHFAVIGAAGEAMLACETELPIDAALLETTWGNLDVWPDSQWLFAPSMATGMLKKVFDLQINRLFWPQALTSGPDEVPLPAYMHKMLRARLKSIYYYGTTDANVEIQVTQHVEDIVQTSLAGLLRAGGTGASARDRRRAAPPEETSFVYRQCYRQIAVQDFLKGLDARFEKG